MSDSADTEPAPDKPPRRRQWRWIVGVVVVVALVAAAPLVLSLDDLRTVPVDSRGARDRLASRTDLPTPTDDSEVVVETPEPDTTPTAAPTADDGAYRSFLVIGSDARAGLIGSRADVLIMSLLPADGSDPIMFSLPRDLWLDDPCRGGQQRISAAYNGCGASANGFELTSIVVEDFTGITVDHVVAIDFEGFKRVINAVGGVEICVDNPVRDGARFDLSAGCTIADGDTALGWVRSRKTQELVDGQWRPMPGVNDLARNERQQELMLELLGRVGSFGTVRNLYGFAQGVSDSVTLGSGLTLLDGARLAWSMRGRADDVRRFSIPVRDMTTSGGAAVLVRTEPFATTFERELGQPLAGA